MFSKQSLISEGSFFFNNNSPSEDAFTFNVNKIAQVCAVEALKDKQFIKKSVKHNILWCKKIKRELEKYKISTNKIGPNFFLLNFNKSKISANKVEKQLEDFGIISLI